MKGDRSRSASERLNAKRSTGKPLAMCEMKTAVVTLDAGKEDEEIRSKYGLAALRQARLARVVHEAWDQGVSLTQEDIAAKLLNCGVRTVRRDIKALAKRGVIVPTRGRKLPYLQLHPHTPYHLSRDYRGTRISLLS